jgi:hypothetical protein
MKTKINPITFFLGIMIMILAGLSVFITLKLKEERPATVPTRTKAADVTYRKLIALNVVTPELLTPTIENSTPTTNIKETGEEAKLTSTPTPINLVTTPLLTSEPTTTELAYNNSSSNTEGATEESEIKTSPTKETVKTLPRSGIYQVSLLIFFGALSLILVSFVL